MGDKVLKARVEGLDVTMLNEAVRALLIRQQGDLVVVANHADVTDNSGGAGTVTKALSIPSAPYDGVAGSTAAQAADLNTDLNAVNNACSVLMDSINDIRVALGLVALGEGDGTIAVADTVAAIAVTTTGVNDATAVDYGSGVAKMQRCANNVATVVRALNGICKAVGLATLADNTGAKPNVLSNSLTNNAAAAATGAATASVSNAISGTFLANARDSITAIATKYNLVVNVTPGALGIVAG